METTRTRRMLTGAMVLGASAILLAVGGPAAVASYRHAAKVARNYGEAEMANWLPLTTDGMLVAALVVMYSRRWNDRPVGYGPWFAFVAGMLATLGANLAAAELAAATGPADAFGRLAVALWPPIAFAFTLELGAMMIRGRNRVTAALDEATSLPPLPATLPEPPATLPPLPEPKPKPAPKPKASRTRPVPMADIVEWCVTQHTERGAMPSQKAIRAQFGASSDRAAEAIAKASESVPSVNAPKFKAVS